MLYVGIFIFELFLLYLLSRNVHIRISQFLFSITGSKPLTTSVIAFLFLPGTFVHELAHWLAAKMLFVHAGRITLVPKLESDRLILGSVPIQKTDPVRRILIGTAPVFLGVVILLGGLYLSWVNGLFEKWWMILVLGYVVFEVGNTMFSSRRDMEGAVWVFGVVLVLAVILYFLGLRISMTSIEGVFFQPIILKVFQKGWVYLLFPVVVDVVLILILKIFQK